MTLNLCNCTGAFVDSEGSPVANTSISLTRVGTVASIGTAPDKKVNIPYVVTVTTDASGVATKGLYPGDYVGVATRPNAPDLKWEIAVPDAASAEWPDIIDSVSAMTPTLLQEATAARDAAAESASAAAASAALADSEGNATAAQAAAAAAEAARDAAFVNADVYADTAAGLTGTTVGDQFLVVSGDEIIRYSHDTGPVATEVARYPAKSLVDNIRSQISLFQTIGRPVDPVTGSGMTGGTWVFGAPVTYDGTLYQVRVYGNATTTLKVRRFARSGTTLTQVGTDTNVNIVAGLNTITVDMDVLAGEYIGFYMPNGAIKQITATGDSNGYWGVSLTDSTSFSDATLDTGLQLQIGFDIRQPFATSARAQAVDDKIATRIPLVFNNSALMPLPEVSASGGAVALTAPAIGYRVPIGQIGNGSFINFYAPLHDPEFAKYNGKQMRLEVVFETENYVERTYGAGMTASAAAASQLLDYGWSYDADRKRLVWTFDFIPVWTAGDSTEKLKFYLQSGTISAAASEITITVVDQFWTPLEAVDPQPELPVMVREVIRQERVARQVLDGEGYTVVTANSDTGSGADFTGNTAIQDAIDSIEDATADNQYEIRATGTFVASQTSDFTKLVDLINTFVHAKDYVHLVGQGSGAHLVGGLPAGAPEDHSLYDVLRQDSNSRVENFFVNGSNIRYGTHFEGAGSTPNITRTWKAVHVKSDTSTAIGYGGSSGETFVAEDCVFETSGTACLYIHDNGNFAQPMMIDLRRCDLRTGSAGVGRSLQLQSLGSFMRSTVRLTDTVLPSGSVVSFLDGWLQGPMADHSGWRLSASGHEPRSVQTSTLRANVLRIVSDTTGASSAIIVDETSSAFDAIFGDSAMTDEYEGPLWFTHQHGYQRKAGGVGLAGEAISGLDLDGVPHWSTASGAYYETSLGKRLGDCSSVNKTLVVNVDGTDRTITFDKNYDGTGATSAPTYDNAAILAEINTALSGHATASIVALGRYHYPMFKGNEVRSNSDSTAVLRGMGVVFSGLRTARIATAADTKIDGIALDDAAPGERFRMITCGEIFTQNSGEYFTLREASSVAHTVGTELGISGTDGVFSASGANKVLRVVAANVTELI